MRILFVSLFVIVLDQVTKFLIKGISIPSIGLFIDGIPFRTSINIISDVVQITYIENPGMAFGLQLGSKLFLSVFTVFATFLIVYFIYRNRKEPFYIRFALALILGGAVGNLIDRLFYGMIYGYAPLFYGNVVDFIHVNIPDIELFGKTFYSFPIFNVADVAVSVGFVLILFGYNKIFKHHSNIDPEILAGGGILITEYPVEDINTGLNSNETSSLNNNDSMQNMTDGVQSDLEQRNLSSDEINPEQLEKPEDEENKI